MENETKVMPSDLSKMELHDVITVNANGVSFRIMKVMTGWLYDFWDVAKVDYQNTWTTFVPYK